MAPPQIYPQHGVEARGGEHAEALEQAEQGQTRLRNPPTMISAREKTQVL